MEDFSEFIGIGSFLFFIGLGLIVGRSRERRHFRNLGEREARTADILVTQLKSFPSAIPGRNPPVFLAGEAVIATDYLKSFLAQWRNIFGGEVGSYQTLLIRARREALLRVVEQAKERGFNGVCNVRFQTADVGGNSSMRKVAMASIIATGTAYYVSRDES